MEYEERFLTGYQIIFERTQFVDFDGTFSKRATVCYGVPQGSILGPLLYMSNSNLDILFHDANIEMNK